MYRSDLNDYINSLDSSIKLTKADKFWMEYIKNDNNDTFKDYQGNSKFKKLKYLYQSKANLFDTHVKGFDLFINPVLGVSYGSENISDNRIGNPILISRGAEIRGSINKKVGFYTYMTENVASLDYNTNEFYQINKVVPGEGFIKPSSMNSYDYINTRGYITFTPTKNIRFQFGNDKNFIGDGKRSLILSDFAKDYMNLKITTKIWKFQYQNIFAQLTDYDRTSGKSYNKKYGAFHHLSINVTKWWNVGLYEGIIMWDNQNNGRGFDVSYLNPVIFYRSVEQHNGSVDNALLAGNTSIIFGKHFKLYGQLLLDEFRINEIRNDKGWIGNKYAIQAGLKYIDAFGLPNVDIQVEYNRVRPYTYTSDTMPKSYTHFRQPLAHQLGANFDEMIGSLTINSIPRLNVMLEAVMIHQGKSAFTAPYNFRDPITTGINYGDNPNYDYSDVSRTRNYGNEQFQGFNLMKKIINVKASYMLMQNLFVFADARYLIQDYEVAKSPLLPDNGKESKSFNSTYINAGIRFNFITQDYQF
jgi:hypothetical protein